MPPEDEKHQSKLIPARRAQTLYELKEIWPEAQAKRARGGWWALSGFTFQMLVALNQFLKDNLLTTSAPSISVEELSDILLAEADQYRLTQVKRTLSNSALISAVREAYEIVNLAEEPLRERLVFQIVCRENQSNIAVGAVTADQVFAGKSHDSEVYAQTLKRFDSSDPVLISAHPASAILLTLWNAGVENPSSAMVKALGYVFSAFDGQAIERVQERVFDALDSIRTSIKQPRTAGRLLSSADFAIHATSSPQVPIFNWRPRREDLRLGRFLQRRDRLSPLEAGASKWIDDVPGDLRQQSSKLPIFWIEGRRGDGKSVALLQVAERLLATNRLASITELRDVDELKLWLDTRPEVMTLGDELPVDFAFIDDLPAQMDPEVLEIFIDTVFFRGDRAAALLTSGTSEDLTKFRALSNTEIRPVVIRPPDGPELILFRDWLETRTGKPVEKLELVGNSLATWLYDSYHANRKVQAGGVLREELESDGLFEVIRVTAALNACGIAAPRSLFPENVIERLNTIFAGSSEVNLEIFKDGIRIGHSDTIHSLYKSWSGEETTGQLCQDLGEGLKAVCDNGNDRLARQLLGQLLDRNSLLRRFGMRDAVPIDFAATIWDRSYGHPLASRAALLPLWLSLGKQNKLPVETSAQVRRDAISALKARNFPERMQAEIAYELYQASDEGDRERSAAEATIVKSTDPKVISLLKSCCDSRKTSAIPALVTKWMQRHRHEPAAAVPIQALLSKPDAAIVDLAYDFVEHNLSNAKSGAVLVSVAGTEIRSSRFYPLVDSWLNNPSDSTSAIHLFDKQLRRRNGEDYVTRALAWGHRNINVKGIHVLLAALVVKAGEDQEVRDLTRQWLLTQPTLSDANPLLLTLAKSESWRSETLDLILHRLDNDPRDSAWKYLFHQVKVVIASMTAPDVERLERRQPRGPANILKQLSRGRSEHIEEKKQPDRRPRKRREKYASKSPRR